MNIREASEEDLAWIRERVLAYWGNTQMVLRGELVDAARCAALVADDLRSLAARLGRREILLGVDDAGREVALPVYDARLLVAGPSGSGKSTLTTGVLERLIAAGYQVCLIDPEGDYEAFAGVAELGDERRAPPARE